MDFLIDTQVVIWAKENNPKLNPKIREIIENSDNQIFVSHFSLQEIAIKLKIGKLPEFLIDLNTFTQMLIEDNYEILPIKTEHIITYDKIPLFEDHKDPFDRFILATAFFEGLTLISSDEKFKKYTDILTILIA